MSRLLRPALMAAAAILLAACASPSLHPAATERSRAADPGIVGEWTTEGPTVIRASIAPPTAAGPYRAALTVHDSGEFKTALDLELTLTDIGDYRYADLFLAEPERNRLAEKYGLLAIPVHQIMRFERGGDELRLWSFNAGWLRGQPAPSPLRTEQLPVGAGEATVMTSDTEALRDFLARRASDPAAFDEPLVFRRAR